jgi:excisionase family DNA binding protein
VSADVAPKSWLLTVPEAAAMLGIGERTAYNLIDNGTFPVPVRMVGNRMRISRAELAAFCGVEP